MTKRMPLDRLRQLSKQRSIRKTPYLGESSNGARPSSEFNQPTYEWPILVPPSNSEDGL